MAERLTPERLRARANAYEEAAGHLDLAWTDNALERAEGNALTRLFFAECARLRAVANERELKGGTPGAIVGERAVAALVPKRASALTDRQRELMEKVQDDWADLPRGVGCTNGTLSALERRGLVETRIEPSKRLDWSGGWQWRKAPKLVEE